MIVRVIRQCSLLALAASLLARAHGQSIQPLDLKPFTNSAFLQPRSEPVPEWILPLGRQVLDGTPFQVDGLVTFRATNYLQQQHPGRTNIMLDLAPQRVERVHLLAATDLSGGDHAPLARLGFLYTDGSKAAVEIRYGDQLRSALAPWHKPELRLGDSSSRMAWWSQYSGALPADSYVRLFHLALTNPSPEKEVRALSLDSAGTTCGLVLAGLSVGPAHAEPLANTWAAPKNPFPDLRPRHGDSGRIEGTVRTTAGQPLENARVRITTTRHVNNVVALPITGDPNVGVEMVTDADGHFILPPVPDTRLYRLLVVADGFSPAFYAAADPKSDPIEIRLAPAAVNPPVEVRIEPAPADVPVTAITTNSIRGRVVGPNGQPVAWALAEPTGFTLLNPPSAPWGYQTSMPQGRPLVADSKGEFTLAMTNLAMFRSAQLRITAPGFAAITSTLQITNAPPLQTVQLDVGATLTGRVLKNGQPLPHVRLGLQAVTPQTRFITGLYEADTDTTGVFTFHHLPPNLASSLYGEMSSFAPYGSLPKCPVETGDHGQTNNVGDLTVARGLHLAGKVRARHGEPLPEGLQVVLNDQNNDSQSAQVGDSGSFSFEGISSSQVRLNVDSLEWRFTTANRSVDIRNARALVGLLEADKDDLIVEIEPFEAQFGFAIGGGMLPQQDMAQNRPLSGAEPSGLPLLQLSGTVVSDQTGKPVPRFKLVPGYQNLAPNGPKAPAKSPLQQMFPGSARSGPIGTRPFWADGSGQNITNNEGAFSFPLPQLTSAPVLRIEAEGFVPLETDPLTNNTTNLVVRLKPGAGPNGVVLDPDGQPVEKAMVVFAADQDTVSLRGRQWQTFSSSLVQQVTGTDGRFSFEPRLRGTALIVSHLSGWAELPIEPGGDNLKIHLKPWAALKGILVDTNGAPVAGITLQLANSRGRMNRGYFLQFQTQTTTDSQGRFEFKDVPPRRIEVQRRFPRPSSVGMVTMMQTQTWLDVEPGITNDLGKITLDTPPPLPLAERIKQQLGF